MKTILTFLLLACVAVQAQETPAGVPPPPPAATPEVVPAAPPAAAPVPDEPARRARVRLAAPTNVPSLPAPSVGTPAATRGAAPTPAQPAYVPPGAAPAAPGVVPALPALPTPQPAAGAVDSSTPAGTAGAAPASPTGANQNADLNFDFPALDLNTFLNDFYAPTVGRTLLRSPTLPQVAISLHTMSGLTREETIQVFDTLLAMNGISTLPVGQKLIKVVPTATAQYEAQAFGTLSTNLAEAAQNLPPAAQLVSEVVQLKYLRPSEIVPALTPFARTPFSILPIEGSQTLVIRDFAENVSRMLEMIDKLDVAIPEEYVSEVIPIKYAKVADIQSALSSLSGGGGGATIGAGARGAGSRTAARGASGFGQRGGVGGAIGASPLGTPGITPGATGLTPAMPGAGVNQPSLSQRIAAITTGAGAAGGGQIEIIGQTKIIADEVSNSLLVFANRADMKMIKDIIAKLDVVQPQVIIEALILEVTVGNSLNYGVSWLQQPRQAGKFSYASGLMNGPSPQNPLNLASNAFPSGLSWFGRYNNDFDVAVQAAASDNRVKVLSNPSIQTSHAVDAEIVIGTSQPIVTGTYSYYGGPQTQFSYQNFGITLDVTPYINPDGLVVMDISQTIQSISGYVDVGGGLNEPILANRSANARVSVRSHDAVMLGGFISSNINNTRSGVPILKDIPLLGALFSSNSKHNDRTELIVLIRPTVLPTPEIAAKVAQERQDRLPLVRQSQKEDRDFQLNSPRTPDKAPAANPVNP